MRNPFSVASYLCLLALFCVACSGFPFIGGNPEPSATLEPLKPSDTKAPKPSEPHADTPKPMPTKVKETSTIAETETIPPTPIDFGTPGGKNFCVDASPSHLEVGIYAYVIPEPYIPNRVRIGPGKNNPAKGLAQPGSVMKVIDGPKCKDSQVWWKMDLKFSDLTGWISEGDNQGYWLAPCPLNSKCPP